MQKTSKKAILLVREPRQIRQAAKLAAALLRHLAAHDNLTSFWDVRVDESGTQHAPNTLKVRARGNRNRSVNVLESMGQSGQWIVCVVDGTALTDCIPETASPRRPPMSLLNRVHTMPAPEGIAHFA